MQQLELVAKSLGELLAEVTFVGGSTTILLVDEAAFGGVRQTEDVDIIVDVATYVEYQKLSARLREKGFKEDIGSKIICRWKLESAGSSISLDVMPDSEKILGFSNRWYADAIENANIETLPSGTEIRVVSPAHFLATKLEAFAGRGKGDYLGSRDIEDIVFVLENRTDMMRELFESNEELKKYFSRQAKELKNEKFLNILPGLVADSDSVRMIINNLDLMIRWG